jgi:ABC-type transport system substrate-binding protein
MTRVGNLRRFAGVAGLITLAGAEPALAQQPGGVLRVAHRDSPASMSTLEEVTISTVAAMMGVFNDLVLFDQHVPQNTLQSIVPDLAIDWSWNEDGTELTFRLRRGVRWHDGKPSPPTTCSAPGTCWSADQRPNSASTRVGRGTGTSTASRLMAITR